MHNERELLASLGEHLAASGAPEDELRQARSARRGIDEGFLLVVVGEFNAGKSSILNALLGSEVLQEGVTPTTDKISILVYGPEDRSMPYLDNEDKTSISDEFVEKRELPFQFLDGVALVDTPGTNAVIRRHQTLTEGFLPRADLVLFMTSADRPFTESERQFLTLAKSWGRKVVLVINKMDLLEKQTDITTVHDFVLRNAKEVLGIEPPLFLVSVRRYEREKFDLGFEGLQNFLRHTLAESERAKLKLLSPLGVASQLTERSGARAKASIELLRADTQNLNDLERQLELHRKDLHNDLEEHLRAMETTMEGMEKRGDAFIDSTLRVSRVLDLMNQDKVRAAFEREVIGDAPVALERRVNAVIDGFIERNINFWDYVQRYLSERAKLGVASERNDVLRGARFQYDRQTLLENIGESARREIDGFDRDELSRKLAAEAQASIIQSGMVGVGGLGLGALIAAVTVSRFVDFAGILLGLTVAGFGFLILPRKRAQAKLELRKKLDEIRARLREVLSREHELESDRAATRLRDAVAPYSRFVRSETEKLDRSLEEASNLSRRLAETRSQVERL